MPACCPRPAARPALKQLASGVQKRRASTSILFALSSLSNSRETAHFTKASKLSRVEHSPPLQLIRSSEVHPYPLPDLPPVKAKIRAAASRATTPCDDARSLAVGRAVLAREAKEKSSLARALRRSRQKTHLMRTAAQSAHTRFREQEARSRAEMRIAGLWILGSVGVATAISLYQFWPARTATGVVDSGELGRKIAAKAKGAFSLPEPVIGVGREAATAVTTPVPVVAGSFAAMPAPAVLPEPIKPVAAADTKASWSRWAKGLFWKQN